MSSINDSPVTGLSSDDDTFAAAALLTMGLELREGHLDRWLLERSSDPDFNDRVPQILVRIKALKERAATLMQATRTVGGLLSGLWAAQVQPGPEGADCTPIDPWRVEFLRLMREPDASIEAWRRLARGVSPAAKYILMSRAAATTQTLSGLLASFGPLGGSCCPANPPDREHDARQTEGALEELRQATPVVNAFSSPQVQLRAFDYLIGRMGRLRHGDVREDITALAAQLNELRRQKGQLQDSFSDHCDAATDIPLESLTSLAECIASMDSSSRSFNTRYLMMQQKLQHELSLLTIIINILRTKHDSIKNALESIR